MTAQCLIAFTRCKRTHIRTGVGNGIHPDPVAKQSPTGFLLGWINGYYSNCFIREIAEKPSHDFISNRRFAGSASTGYAEYRGGSQTHSSGGFQGLPQTPSGG